MKVLQWPFLRCRSTAVLCCFVFFCSFVSGASALTVQGVPDWLEDSVLKGLTAVWEEIPIQEGDARFGTLAIVGKRLFLGYHVEVEKNPSDSTPQVLFRVQRPLSWEVKLLLPDLREPVLSWFRQDLRDVEQEVFFLLKDLPVEALSWVDSALREQVQQILSGRLPGWDFFLYARIQDNNGQLELSFRPRQPLVLAVTPSIFSTTLPVMFQSDLKAKLVPDLSPLIGLPVPWVASHDEEVKAWAHDLLKERNAVANTRSRIDVNFVPAPVSQLDATVDSEVLVFRFWLAAYAGIEGRYPEAGFLVGWNMRHALNVPLELYSEGIVELGDFGVRTRLGARFPLGRNFQIGGEVEWPSQTFWYRAWWDTERLKRPYAWWRYNSDNGHSAALGYRINEQISTELYYNEQDDDRLGLRGILLF